MAMRAHCVNAIGPFLACEAESSAIIVADVQGGSRWNE
jgi:hypothetical protein